MRTRRFQGSAPRAALGAVAVGASVVLGACGGGNGSSPSTSASSSAASTAVSTVAPLPPPAVRIADARYLRGPGAILLRFERASLLLVQPALLDKAACQAAKARLQAIGSPNDLARAADGLTDETLRSAFKDDTSAKNLLLAACSTLASLPASYQDAARARHGALATRLARFGIALAPS